VDNVSKSERSKIMSKIKSRDTKIELAVRKKLHALGYRFTVANKSYPGTPDMVFSKKKAVVFVNGCFWHGHEGCRIFRMPKSNTGYWEGKIGKNQARDRMLEEFYVSKGWKAITVWECEIEGNFFDAISKIVDALSD